MDRLLGQSLGRYRLDTLLGEGGMGAVFKAYDVTLQRYVAVKIMHPQYAGTGNFRERFLQEARVAARLSHPSIVQVHDFGQEKDLLYIVMEFIPGANLQQMLNQMRVEGKWLPLIEGVELLRQVALAVDYFHAQGVLHRDLKPANVMLKPEAYEGLPYRPVITDLGLAKLLEGEALTQDGTSMGTPSYMSPEQALGNKVDARSDVYSLGILLFELAVGQLPFPIKTLTEAIRYHTTEPPPLPRSIRPDLPVLLEKVILKAVEKDPDRRIPNAAELAKGLRAINPQVSQAAASTTLLASSVSLVTQYQQSLVEPRGISILQEFAAQPDLPSDSIQVLDCDKSTRSIPFKGPSMLVGRDESCDIVLADTEASRSHVRIELDGGRYRVIDLGSTNGTYFKDLKILPGIPEDWTPEKPLRIGSSYLRLVRADGDSTAERRVTAPVRHSDTLNVDLARLHTSPGGGRAGIYLPETRYKVDAGGTAIIPFTVLNQGGVVDHFRISLQGVPPSWITGELPVIQLMPSTQQQTSLTLQPPLSHRSRAGEYSLSLRAASQSDPNEVAEAKAQLTVNPYTRFTSDFHPQRIRAGAAARITIQNQGNQPETFRLSWRDRGEEVRFEPSETQVTVSEGQSGFADFTARPRQPKWMGSERIFPFAIQVQPARGEAQTHSGEVVARPRLPAWTIPVLLSLCFLLAAAGIPAGYLAYQAMRDATATQFAILSAGTAEQQAAETAQASATLQALLITQAFATGQAGTAEVLGDDDQDGLSNEQEGIQGTLPFVADTDGDGLLDGAEVNQYGTNPKLIDSDGDTLSDGQEVLQLNTSPNNKDTDGDGKQDNVDDDPSHLPTNAPPTPPPATPIPATPVPTTPTNLPGGQLAFVSDVSGQSRVYVSGLNNWQLSISSPLPLPSGYNRALWPDWCQSNQSIVYEIAESETGSLDQVIYSASPQGGSGEILIDIPSGYASLGVPRCPRDKAVVYYSGKEESANFWHLWEFDINSRNSLQLTEGNNIDIFLSAYQSDWGVFMRLKPGGSYQLARLDLDTHQVNDLSVPGFTRFGYPAVDPLSGRVIFGCLQSNWDLCMSDWAGDNGYQVLENITLSATSQINPVWSPDGKWVAFSSNKLQEGQEDYDIWLFAPAAGKSSLVNLTSSYADSDEIHPSWSKP